MLITWNCNSNMKPCHCMGKSKQPKCFFISMAESFIRASLKDILMNGPSQTAVFRKEFLDIKECFLSDMVCWAIVLMVHQDLFSFLFSHTFQWFPFY